MRHIGTIGDKNVAVTDHALTRMVEMEMTPEEFKLLVSDPEEVYTSKKYPDRFFHRRDRFSIAIEEDKGQYVVLTLLYGSMEDWCEAAKNGKLGSRTLKNTTQRRRRRT